MICLMDMFNGSKRRIRPFIRLPKRLAAAALSFVLLLLFGCSAQTPEARRELFSMDTYMNLRAYGDNASEALDTAVREITKLDGLLSVTDPESEISALNSGEGGVHFLSEETFAILSSTLALSDELGDSFEITLRPVSEAWGFTTGEYRIPDETELASLLPLVDDGLVALDANERAVSLPAGVKLDLGAAAKGYAADTAADALTEAGVTSALLDLGSSTIRALGSKPDGSAWRVALRGPGGKSTAGVLELRDACISTSGGYERYFEGEDGEIYWHIIDPSTGRPAKNGAASVSVMTPDAFSGDVLSTALFVMGPDAAEEYYHLHGGFELIILMEDGSIRLTPGAEALFTPEGGADITVIGRD